MDFFDWHMRRNRLAYELFGKMAYDLGPEEWRELSEKAGPPPPPVEPTPQDKDYRFMNLSEKSVG